MVQKKLVHSIYFFKLFNIKNWDMRFDNKIILLCIAPKQKSEMTAFYDINVDINQ